METKRTLLGLSLLLTVVLAGCGPEAEAPGAAVRAPLTPVPHVAWLSRHLPAATIAYVRLPTLWDTFTAPKEDALHPVQVGESHAAQIAAIRQGLLDNVLSQVPEAAKLPVEMLLLRLNSPLEVALLKPGDGSFAPNVLLAATLDYPDVGAFADGIDLLAESNPQLRVMTPTDADGFTTLMAGPAPVFGHFDPREQRLLMLSGMSASQPELAGYVDLAEADNALSGFERGVDASGRGLALWLNLAELHRIYGPMMPPDEAKILASAGLDRARFLWMGAASKGGKSSFKVHLDMPEVGFRRLLARADQAPGLSSAGPADFALRFILPSAAEVAAGLDYVLSLGVGGPEARQKLATVKARMDQALGFDSRLLLDAFGPEIIIVGDQAGIWGGYQIRDRRALDQVIAGIQQVSGTAVRTHRSGGIEIKHWALPALWSLPDNLGQDADLPQPVIDVLGRLKSRLYWVEEDGYLVMASVPQVLTARAQLGADRDLAEWLERDLQLDWRHSVLAFAHQIEDSPRDVYHGYLSAMSVVADVVGAELDPFALPTWIDAGLPASGRLGLRIDSGPDALGLSFDYEYSPVEMLLGGDSTLALVALVGIASAIAVPAYHDYQTRAEIAAALARASAIKVAVAESYLATGRFPDASLAAELTDWAGEVALEVQPDSGVIGIHFTGDGILSGGTVWLQPFADEDGYLSWSCSGENIDSRHLPAVCRD